MADANRFSQFGFEDAPAAPNDQGAPSTGGNRFAQFGYADEEKSAPAKTVSGTAADVAKSAGVGVAKGMIGLPGIVGDIANIPEASIAWLAAHGAEKFGLLPQGKTANDLIRDMRAVGETPVEPARNAGQAVVRGLSNVGLPTSEGMISGAEKLAGHPFYQPQTPEGRFAETAGMFLPAFAAGGAGTVAQRVGGAIVPAVAGAAGSELAGHLTEGTPYEPAARFAGALVGGVAPAAIGRAASGAMGAVKEAIPPFTAAGREAAAQKAVGQEIAQAGGGAPAVQQALAENPNIVPGSEGTLAQRAPALAQWEDTVRTQNKGPFIQRAAEQNAARVEHLAGMQTEGSPLELTEGLRGQRAAVDQATQARLDAAQKATEANRALVEAKGAEDISKAQEARSAALESLRNAAQNGSPQDAAAYFRQIRESLHADAEAQIGKAQAESEAAQKAAAPSLQSVEDAGRVAREPVAEALAARKEADNALYAAAKIPDSATVPAIGVRKAVEEVRGGMVAEDRPLAGEEKRLFDLAGEYGDEISFNRLKSLRSAILDEQAATRRDNPAAYRRLNILRSSVEDAMDHAVENQAALDNIAVSRGAMAPEESFNEKINQFVDEQSSSALAANRVSARSGAGNASIGDAGLYPQAGAGNRGFGNPEGAQGFRPTAGTQGGEDAFALGGQPPLPQRQTGIRTLIDFIKDRGGLKDEGGDLKAAELGKRYRGLINKNGMSLDQAREAAAEAGYLGADIDRAMAETTPNDLLNALESHPSYSVHDQPRLYEHEAYLGRKDAIAQNVEYLNSRFKALGEQVSKAAIDRTATLMHDYGMSADDAYYSSIMHNMFPKSAETAGEFTPITSEQIAALKRANASYREQREIFGEGPIGAVLEKKLRGADFELSNAEVPKKIFHPGDMGGEDVRAYIKAVGEDKATPVLNDLAAFMLHEKAFTNGVPDPKKINSWLAAHKTALSALPEEVGSRFATISKAQQAVEDALVAKRQRLDEFDRSAAARIAGLDKSSDITQTVGGILSQKDGAKIMADLVSKANGNEAAQNGIKQSVAEYVLNKFIPDVSAPRVNAMRDFIADKREVLASAGFKPEEIAALDAKASAVTEAEQGVKAAGSAKEQAVKSAKAQGEAAVKEAQAARETELSKYDRGVLSTLVNASSEGDIIGAVKGLFYGSNPSTKMAQVAKEAKSIQGGTEALHKAVAKMIEQEFTSTAEAGATGTMSLKGAPLQKFVRDKADVMKAAGLSDEQIGRLSAIVQDQQRAARSINNAKLAGQSNTTPDALAAMRRSGTGSIMSELANEQAVQLATGAAGAAAQGVGGGVIGYLGTKLYGALREAGLARMNELRLRASMDPDFALALLEKVPQKPDTGAAALVALRARQMALGALTASGNRSQQRQ